MMDGSKLNSPSHSLADSRMMLGEHLVEEHLTNSLDLSSTSTMNLDIVSSLTPRPSVIASAFSDNESLRCYSNGSNNGDNPNDDRRQNPNLKIDHETNQKLTGRRNFAESVIDDCQKIKNWEAVQKESSRPKDRKRKSTRELNHDPEFDPRMGKKVVPGSYLEMRRKNNVAVKKSR